MKIRFSILFVFFIQATIYSQSLPEWFRVYTFEDNSIIELNTNFVMFSTAKYERVRFRWTYTTPQFFLDKNSKIQFHSILQEIKFDCENKRYGVYKTEWFDADGKLIMASKPSNQERWSMVNHNGIIGKLFPQSCKLIALRRREPPILDQIN